MEVENRLLVLVSSSKAVSIKVSCVDLVLRRDLREGRGRRPAVYKCRAFNERLGARKRSLHGTN